MNLIDPWLTLNPIPRPTWLRVRMARNASDPEFLRKVIAYHSTAPEVRRAAQLRLDELEQQRS